MLTYVFNLTDNKFHMIYGPIIQPMLIKMNIFTKISQKIFNMPYKINMESIKILRKIPGNCRHPWEGG